MFERGLDEPSSGNYAARRIQRPTSLRVAGVLMPGRRQFRQPQKIAGGAPCARRSPTTAGSYSVPHAALLSSREAKTHQILRRRSNWRMRTAVRFVPAHAGNAQSAVLKAKKRRFIGIAADQMSECRFRK